MQMTESIRVFDARKPSVLIVDDEDTNIHILAEALRDNYEIYICKEAEQVFSLACEISPNIILLDIMMPVMDGYQVCRQLKDSVMTRDIPVIFITARTDEHSESYGFDLGAIDYIHKPFHISLVRARVQAHVTVQGMLERLISTNMLLNERIREIKLGHSNSNIDKLTEALDNIKLSQELYAKVFNSTAEAVVVTDYKNRIIAVNKSFTRITGYEQEESLEKTPDFLINKDLRTQLYRVVLESLNSAGFWSGEVNFRRKNGELFPVLQSVSRVLDDQNQITHYVTVFSDVKSVKISQEKINFLTWYDSLTQLPNRHLFLDRLSQSIGTLIKNTAFSSVMVVNLSGFKNINFAHGLLAGDQVLIAVAKMLKELFGDEDTVCRLSSDEFAILINSQDKSVELASERALRLSERIRYSLHESISIPDVSVIRLTATIGITVYPNHEKESAHEILQHAVIARHKAQSNNQNQQATFFSDKMGELALKRFEIEQELANAIEHNQLEIYLQSKVDMDGRVVGAESLVRWNHPVRGVIPPDVFIPIAEDSDLILKIDKWMLAEAVKVINLLEASSKNITISVNISPHHFKDSSLEKVINELMLNNKFQPDQLILEVTESVLIGDVEMVIAVMNKISKLGIHFSADDFGTGYCSLAYLKRLPIKEIKIDKSFILEAPHSPSDKLLVDMVYSISTHMGISTVAEGVESINHVEFLKSYPNMIHQGYFYGKPIPANLWLEGL